MNKRCSWAWCGGRCRARCLQSAAQALAKAVLPKCPLHAGREQTLHRAGPRPCRAGLCRRDRRHAAPIRTPKPAAASPSSAKLAPRKEQACRRTQATGRRHRRRIGHRPRHPVGWARAPSSSPTSTPRPAARCRRVARTSHEAEFLAVDLTDAASIAPSPETVQRKHGAVDDAGQRRRLGPHGAVLGRHAGVLAAGGGAQLRRPDDADQALLPAMMERRAARSSTWPAMPAASAAWARRSIPAPRGGLIAFTKALARETAPLPHQRQLRVPGRPTRR